MYKHTCVGLACDLVEVLSSLTAIPKVAKSVSKTCAVADALLAVLHATAITAWPVANASLMALLRCLVSPYPRLRVHIAEQMYARFVELSVFDECFLDTEQLLAAQNLLGCSIWDAEDCFNLTLDRVSRLALVFKIERGQIQPGLTTSSMKMPRDELDSYSNLVKEAGY